MPPNSQKTNDRASAVSVRGVSLAYGEHVVLADVSFELPKGAVCAIVGPNGSGKSTLLRAMLGLHPIASGEILVSGRHPHEIRGSVGYVPQRFNIDADFPITVREFLELTLRRPCGGGCVERTTKEVGLTPSILDHLLGRLSGGQLQRVLIAQAILNDPELLFLDEPATGIDVRGEEALYEVVRHLKESHGTTVVLVSHDIAMVHELVDRVVCVNQRLLCEGPPRTTLTPKKLTELYGGASHAFPHRHERHHPNEKS